MLSSTKDSGERNPLTYGVRRFLGLANPGIDEGKWAAKETLWAAYQYIHPGIESSAYHHSASTIRFIIYGNGAYTTTRDDRCIIEKGDLAVKFSWV